MGGLDDARRRWRRPPRGSARAARRLHRLPQPGDAGQDGRHRRRDQRRPADPRPRGGLERDRVPRRSASRSTTASRASRRRSRSSGRCSAKATSTSRARSTRRATASSCRAPARPGGPPLMVGSSGRGCSRSRCPTSTRGTSGSPTPATARGRRAAPRQVDEACRAVGRDPAEVERTVAVLVRLPGGTGRVTQDDDATSRRLTVRASPEHRRGTPRLRPRGHRPRPARRRPDHDGVARSAGPRTGDSRPGPVGPSGGGQDGGPAAKFQAMRTSSRTVRALQPLPRRTGIGLATLVAGLLS